MNYFSIEVCTVEWNVWSRRPPQQCVIVERGEDVCVEQENTAAVCM